MKISVTEIKKLELLPNKKYILIFNPESGITRQDISLMSQELEKMGVKDVLCVQAVGDNPLKVVESE